MSHSDSTPQVRPEIGSTFHVTRLFFLLWANVIGMRSVTGIVWLYSKLRSTRLKAPSKIQWKLLDSLDPILRILSQLLSFPFEWKSNSHTFSRTLSSDERPVVETFSVEQFKGIALRHGHFSRKDSRQKRSNVSFLRRNNSGEKISQVRLHEDDGR